MINQYKFFWFDGADVRKALRAAGFEPQVNRREGLPPEEWTIYIDAEDHTDVVPTIVGAGRLLGDVRVKENIVSIQEMEDAFREERYAASSLAIEARRAELKAAAESGA